MKLHPDLQVDNLSEGLDLSDLAVKIFAEFWGELGFFNKVAFKTAIPRIEQRFGKADLDDSDISFIIDDLLNDFQFYPSELERVTFLHDERASEVLRYIKEKIQKRGVKNVVQAKKQKIMALLKNEIMSHSVPEEKAPELLLEIWKIAKKEYGRSKMAA